MHLRLFGFEKWTWWSKSTFTAASDESFGIVPCTPFKDIILATDLKKLKPGYQYIAQRTFAMPPFLPVQTSEERRLFELAIQNFVGHKGIGQVKTSFKVNWEDFCERWNTGNLDVGDGRLSRTPMAGNNIFKKQPYALRSYYEKVSSMVALIT